MWPFKPRSRPMTDSIWQDVYIVKAAAEEGTTDSWSVTAGAFCTPSTVTTKLFESSLFDSTAIKKVTNPNDAAGAGVVFQGFDADAGLTTVTAHAVESRQR